MTPQAGQGSEHGRPQRHPGPRETASGPGRRRRQAGPGTGFSLAIAHTGEAMTYPTRDHEELLRRALHTAAELVEPAGDGLERIRARLSPPGLPGTASDIPAGTSCPKASR